MPRTVLGLLVGAALGLAGAVMQGVTRNPLADPGILGVNAGAALFVVIGIYWFGVASLLGYVWFAFVGAAVATVVVYALGSLGRERRDAGEAGAGRRRADRAARLDHHGDPAARRRHARPVPVLGGRLARRPHGDDRREVAPFLVVGCVLALASARSLNTLALGDDVARSLGQRVGLSRARSAPCASCCCAARRPPPAGPIGFVGLTVPHVARAITGPDYRWILPYSMVLAPILLLGADVIGRVVARPGELQVGIVTAFIGAPFFIVLVRRRKLAEL